MKLIFIKEHKGLLASPEVNRPACGFPECGETYCDCPVREDDRNAYNLWLTTKIEIPEGHLHLFKDREEYEEGVDYEIKERWKPLQEAGSSGIIYQPILIAIPISNQQEGRGVEGDEVERSIEQYQRLFNAISVTNGTALQSEMDDIIRIVHEDFPINNKPKNTLNG